MKMHFRQRFETLCYSVVGDVGPTNEMVNFLCASVIEAQQTIIKHAKPTPDSHFLNVFPGEHYRLLKSMTRLLQASTVVDIGTGSGLNCVAFFEGSDNTVIHSFDNVPMETYQTNLTQGHIASPRFFHHQTDLSFEKKFEENRQYLESAQIIMFDGPKDGRTERFILDKMSRFETSEAPRYLVIDDIKMPVMIDLWCSIASPKIDFTSFGHWAGTGIVDIRDGLKFHQSPNQIPVP
jgi:hypothetical protein